MKIFYKTSETATGGRDGRTQVEEGSIGVDLLSGKNDLPSKPPEEEIMDTARDTERCCSFHSDKEAVPSLST